MREKVQYDSIKCHDFFLDIFSSNIRSTIKEVQSQVKGECFKNVLHLTINKISEMDKIFSQARNAKFCRGY